jgi:hypothetical protein
MARLLSNALTCGAVLALTLATAFSCKTFDLPAETCNPGAVVTLLLNAPSDCRRCLEDNCCDAVGVCERTENCADVVAGTQSCVIVADGVGPITSEKECAETVGLTARNPDGSLSNPAADSVYRCMRGACGAPCKLPVCQVDQAARLILNPQCDQCFASGCCAELNSCYQNRACKLTLECIISDCGSELGKALEVSSGDTRFFNDVGDADQFCAAKPADLAVPACVQRCLCQYRDNDRALPPAEASGSSINLAAAVYVCGRGSACGKDCRAGDAGKD